MHLLRLAAVHMTLQGLKVGQEGGDSLAGAAMEESAHYDNHMAVRCLEERSKTVILFS